MGYLVSRRVAEPGAVAAGQAADRAGGSRAAPGGRRAADSVDARIIAATSSDLGALVVAGKFREDLHHRLDLFRVRLPPLRERGDDIVVLAEKLLFQVCRRYGQKPPAIPADGQARFARLPLAGQRA